MIIISATTSKLSLWILTDLERNLAVIQLDLFLEKCMLNYKFLYITLRMFGDNKPPQPFSDTLIDKITLSYWIIKHIK